MFLDNVVNGDNSGNNGDIDVVIDFDDYDLVFIFVLLIDLVKLVVGIFLVVSGMFGNYDVIYSLVGSNNGNIKFINF